MARTAITTTKVGPATVYGQGGDIAYPAGTTIDATLVTNGIALTCTKRAKVQLIVTNTSAANKSLVFKRPASSQDAALGDWTTTAIPLTSGQRVFTIPSGFLDPDGTTHIDLQSGHTGVFQALEGP